MAILMWVNANHFCCGLEFTDNHICVKAAPICKWAIGKQLSEVHVYFVNKHYEVMFKQV